MFCTRCGNKLEPASRFCPSCGAPVAAQAPYQQPFAASRLMRPRNNRMIAGVCAAFALQYGWDLTVTRIVTALMICLTGIPAFAYLIAWVIIPEEPYALPTNGN